MKASKGLLAKLLSYYKKRKARSLYFYPIAVLYYRNRESDKAYQTLIDGLQLYPRYALALVKVGEILFGEGSYESALAYLETAVNIQKTNTKALRLLGETYEKLSKFNEAISVYEKLAVLEPSDWVKDKLLELASKAKPDEEKLSEIVEELESEHEDVPTIELEDEEVPESVALDIEEVAAEESSQESEEGDEEEATITLAKLYEKQGYIDDAIKVYRKILEKEPDNIEAKKDLDKLISQSGLNIDKDGNDA
ncbi:tetratricopeptide repeat protein [Hippea maritima]|uniref:Tetratricopeptide TPR_2 repeat-containing protein n=1 Tax=Hippea maritima (strain ATCC 700847 / DSM 10411 / MH2) TaxID=760142 RepID=F2LXL9_HIPMA|nr:tetratricopeptide repeat protein [Hippea maritima]AEA33205.1 Tetratricopeptide TPR_2 repeat-containing protein [Hippea maritima DSM 10411]